MSQDKKYSHPHSVPVVRLLQSCFALMVFVGLGALEPVRAQEESQDYNYWATYNQTSDEEIDHSTWNRILTTYVNTSAEGQNFFNYASVSPADQRALTHYLEMLSGVSVTQLNKDEQLAFWLNAYNAIVVQLILENYPVDSILDVGGNLFNRGPWRDIYLSIEGKPISLSHIRYGILLPIWQDVRVIYGLSCAAIGCPNIGSKAAQGKNVQGYLDAAALAFINGPNAILEFAGDGIRVSNYFQWNKLFLLENDGTFNKNRRLLEHIKSQATGKLYYKLDKTTHINGFGFNWDLNQINNNQ